MRKRIARWLIQTVALWAVQRIARTVAERFTESDQKKNRAIPVDYERTSEERIGPGAAGSSGPKTGTSSGGGGGSAGSGTQA